MVEASSWRWYHDLHNASEEMKDLMRNKAIFDVGVVLGDSPMVRAEYGNRRTLSDELIPEELMIVQSHANLINHD
jgi:hypothetical protein